MYCEVEGLNQAAAADLDCTTVPRAQLNFLLKIKNKSCTLGQNQGVENSNSFYRHTRRTVGFYDKKNYA